MCATLVRLPAGEAPRGAVLYVHGFIDYFFQRHMAERFAPRATRSTRSTCASTAARCAPHQHPNFCKDIAEYYADITRAIDEIGAPVLLAGHSTGGLVCSLYAHEGERRGEVRALWLNSPFFDWQLPDCEAPAAARRRGDWAASSRSSRAPSACAPDYGQALLEHWEFDTRLKPVEGFPVYFGWIGAINDAHAKVHRGLAIGCPVLSMHSDEADSVLDWRAHRALVARPGPRVAVLAFPGGVHDLVLSRPRDPRGSVQAAFRLGGTNLRVSSVAAAQAT